MHDAQLFVHAAPPGRRRRARGTRRARRRAGRAPRTTVLARDVLRSTARCVLLPLRRSRCVPASAHRARLPAVVVGDAARAQLARSRPARRRSGCGLADRGSRRGWIGAALICANVPSASSSASIVALAIEVVRARPRLRVIAPLQQLAAGRACSRSIGPSSSSSWPKRGRHRGAARAARPRRVRRARAGSSRRRPRRRAVPPGLRSAPRTTDRCAPRPAARAAGRRRSRGWC